MKVRAKRKDAALTRKLNKKGLREKKPASSETGEKEATSDSQSICVVRAPVPSFTHYPKQEHLVCSPQATGSPGCL